MALPQINVPQFECTLPSTGEPILFRPFLVGEEKILLIALEGQDEREIANAIMNILKSCIIAPTNLSIEKLPTFDIEYLFLKLRAKSAGEVIEMSVGHPDSNLCDHKTKINLNIDNIEVDTSAKSEPKIMLTDNIGIVLKYPSMRNTLIRADNDFDNALLTISSCVDTIFEINPEVMHNDLDQNEVNNWLMTLNQEQFQKIVNFFDNMPKLSTEISWKCSNCGKTDSLKIQGLQNFFS